MRRKIYSFILIVTMLLVLMPDTAMAAKMEGKSLRTRETVVQTGKTDAAVAAGVPVDMEGSGTAVDPYRIKDAGQLCYFADMVNGAGGAPDTGLCAVLTQNIDLSGVCGAETGSWTPVGTGKNPYTGTFDGGSYTVSGLYYHKPDTSYAGLFGCNAGTIRNLGVVGSDIAAGSYTGGVCGSNRGTIAGCYNASPVSGDSYTGGICGYNDGSGIVSVCYNTGTVSGGKYVGGICGYNRNEASNCYNMGTVNGSGTSVGGVCGYNKKLVSACYNTGEVGGKDYVGSVCGYNHSESAFLNCYYLITGTEKGSYGAGMTRQQFASGEVCWLLNGGKSENVVWHQTCGAGFPAFGGKTVYQTQIYKGSGSAKEVIVAYTNDKNKRGMVSQAAPVVTADADNNATETSDNGVSDESADGHVYEEPEWEWKEYKSAKAVFTCRDCGEKLTLKASVKNKTTAATCVADGKTVYTASVDRDDQTYKDTKTVKIEKTGHQISGPTEEKLATCEEVGIRKGYWTCLTCRKYFADEAGAKEIPRKEVEIEALGHTYSDTYNNEKLWQWNMKSNPPFASVTLVCTRCGGREEKEADVTSDKKADCTTAGEVTYTAVVNFNGQSFKDVRTESGQPAPHSFGEPEWASDGSNATFICKVCGHKENEKAKITSETTPSTCEEEGEIVYTAVVEFGGREYSKIVRTEALPKADHTYGEPEWTWAKDNKSATATFTCSVCETSESVATTDVQKSDPPGISCEASGEVTYTAKVTFKGKPYEGKKVEKISVDHSLVYVKENDATCEVPGNEEYWKCSKCPKLFADAEGMDEIKKIPEIPATGHHIEKGTDGQYECVKCHMKFTGIKGKDGTISFQSVEDGTIVPQDEKKNDNTVGFADPDGEKADQAEPAREEPSLQSGPEEKQEETVPRPAEGQAGQNGQPGESVPGGQDEQPGESVRTGQDEQPGEEMRKEQGESRDGVIDAPENVERQELIYPEGAETGTDSVAEDAREESAVSLRAEAAGNSAETVWEQQGLPAWGSAAVLAVLVGIVLAVVLKKENN